MTATSRQEAATLFLQERHDLTRQIVALIGEFAERHDATPSDDASEYIWDVIGEIFGDDICNALEIEAHDAPCHKDYDSFHRRREDSHG